MNYFTSESVSEGHPDKIADQISDAILDSVLSNDKNCAVACETMIKNSLIIVSGEITTNLWVDLEEIIYDVVSNIGYDDISKGLSAESISIINLISKQSQEIHNSVFDKSNICIGAGDQGIMFGYACNETENYMPAPIFYANKLLIKLAALRKSKEISWLRPDAKSQVTVQYDDKGKAIKIDTVLLSTQHDDGITQEKIRETLINKLIKESLPKNLIDNNTKYIINPSGSFIKGGPHADCGLTGRKIIVDTYGGYARHGGGAFSGKDPSKVDRSASYMARYIAKNLVAANFADKCEIQLSYGIGLSEPLSIYINTFGTSKYSDNELIEIIKRHFNLTPQGIIDCLSLKNIRYLKTASYGHFGRLRQDFT